MPNSKKKGINLCLIQYFGLKKILHSVSAQCENLEQKNKTMSVLSTNLSAEVSEKLKIVSLQVLDLQICS